MSDWKAIRKQAANRRRRVIYNNDGDEVFQAAEPTPESFLAVRSTGLEGSHVDTYVYSTLSNFNSCVHNSRFAEINRIPNPFQFKHNHTQSLIDQGRDSLNLIIDFCRKNGIEVFWSARMNDMHDHWEPRMMTAFRREHPELRLWRDGDYGRPGEGTIEPHMYAIAMDYGQEEVRQVLFDTIMDVAERYDVDGIELDFLREPAFFRPTMEGRRVEAEHAQIMTDFVRRVRARIDEIGQKRGKPILLSVRVPNQIDRCQYIGLDVEQWLTEDLLDLLISSIEFTPFTGDIRELAELGHSKGVSVYACLSGSLGGVEGWSAATTNAISGGADGIVTYNNFNPRFPGWRVLGDPEKVRQADKMYALDDFRKVMSTHQHVIDRRGLLPIPLKHRDATEVVLPVQEDLSGRTAGAVVRLSLDIDGCAFGDRVDLQINGSPLRPERSITTQGVAPRAVGKITFVADVDPAALIRGNNRVSIAISPTEPRDLLPVLSDLRILIRHTGNRGR